MLFSLFENVLDAYAISPRQVVLAFSGGIDSRVLLDLLSIYRNLHPQHHYLVIHVHHGLSQHADQWMKQCEQWATDEGFTFIGVNVYVECSGESIEKSARDARYQAIIDNVEANALILTGQHSDDQAETFLLAMKRGSGPAGLAAMPVLRQLGHAELLRPLLSVTRKEIESYADEQGLSWVEDESNLDCRFDRNFIRQLWLPPALARWPSLTKAINRTAELCSEQEQLLEELLSGYDNQVTLGDGILSLAVLNSYSPKMKSALVRRWLKQTAGLTISQVQLKELFLSVIAASDDANPKLHLDTWQVRRFQQGLYVVPEFKDISNWYMELEFGISLILPDGVGEVSLQSCGGCKLSLRAPTENEKVWVGFNPEGLSAHPIGRQGKRKLKKLYQEYGVPSWLRRRTPLVFYGENLAAVAGLFVCKGFEGLECDLLWHNDYVLSA